MKNLKLMLITLLLSAGTAYANGNKDVISYSIDKNKSQVEWEGKKVIGSHTGTIDVKQGSFSVQNGTIKSATISIDMTSIKNTDLDPSYQPKLVGHLKSDDFFGVRAYPEANFKSSKFIAIPNAKSGQNNYMVYGELTIKGSTHQIEFPALVIIKNNKVLAEGTMIFDRSKYNVRYGSTSFFDSLGDKAIMDDIELEFSIVANSVVIN